MKVWILLLLGFINYAAASVAKIPQKVELANQYHKDINLTDYLVSEKFDGVRAIWNGHNLITKSGLIISAPAWFIEPLDNEVLEGELWSGYKQFAFVSALARSKRQRDADWQQVRYLVFDAPDPALPFSARYQHYQAKINRMKTTHIHAVEQLHFEHQQQLEQYYQMVLMRGGEGLILHQKHALHQAGRSDRILKYKPYQDAEAIVIGYTEGKGKYKGMIGALKVKSEQGLEFKIGTGISDQLRQQPPKIGSQITYRYQGLTKYGKPRFARFLRMRPKL
ncbi:DNA ligase [Pseudoalteromonas holothuriae]|uniref:DNA ligase n=1 Tax=Pseudoalteromonas holothuriae TaxID=2963714 RepID=A0ABN8UP16_9GAMM|nr:DNA ligase [Pseudoalteromonas sp. CIP111951]CAH9064244.1 DNA ligase [Pseudoalteromonas sp. CIP111951]